MMFKHGFVHCDPHHANVLIRPLPGQGRLFIGKNSDYCFSKVYLRSDVITNQRGCVFIVGHMMTRGLKFVYFDTF